MRLEKTNQRSKVEERKQSMETYHQWFQTMYETIYQIGKNVKKYELEFGVSPDSNAAIRNIKNDLDDLIDQLEFLQSQNSNVKRAFVQSSKKQMSGEEIKSYIKDHVIVPFSYLLTKVKEENKSTYDELFGNMVQLHVKVRDIPSKSPVLGLD